MSVVYNGVKNLFQPVDPDTKNDVLNRYTEGVPYFVFVGLIHERKNLQGLLRAFDLYRSETSEPRKLVVIGERKWWTSKIEEAYSSMKLKDDIVFTGRLPDEELRLLLASSQALCYVPFFEGFGIPILEAMKSGTAVITSNRTSMPEVSGDAALLCDPDSHEQIKDQMIKLESEAGLRQKLIDKGMKRADEFSWDRTADLTWKCIERTIR